MAIIGIGTDLIEISRVREACRKQSFLDKVYTKKEQELIEAHPLACAGNFAVKEAVTKALGTGFRTFGPEDIEVLRDELGAPFVKLYGNAARLAEEKRIDRWHVTISHSRDLVTATVVGEHL